MNTTSTVNRLHSYNAGTGSQRTAVTDNCSVFPVSFAQQRVWFLDQLTAGSPLYNLTTAVRVEGDLNDLALHHALNCIVDRHESLRTTFAVSGTEPVQVITPLRTLDMPCDDLSALDADRREEELARITREEARRPFDLTGDLMLRARLVRLEETEHVLLLTMHHIASDGWSMNILFHELAALYETACRGIASPLPELGIQCADYAVWQREWLQGETLQNQLSYWRKKLENAPRMIELPTDRPRPARPEFHGAVQKMVLSPSLSNDIRRFAKAEGMTLFMTTMAAFQTLLYRYTGQEDFLIGSPIAGRNRTEIEGLIGFFVNTLAWRASVQGNPTFRELLQRVKETSLDAYAHQDVPFERLAEELLSTRGMGAGSVLQVMFAVQSEPLPSKVAHGVRFDPEWVHSGTSKFDLTVSVGDDSDGMTVFVEYNTGLFNADTIRRLLNHFSVLLENLVMNPTARISSVPIMTTAERRQILLDWNDTKAEFPESLCLHQLFEYQAAKTPAAAAIVTEQEVISYGDLNHRANRLARYLRRLGVVPESVVGICMKRTPEMIVSLLAVLKAGGAYVALDPAYPKERLRFMIEDAGLHVLMADGSLVHDLPEFDEGFVVVPSQQPLIELENDTNLPSAAAPDNLAYLIYTSGSSGRPKGVLIEHRSVVNVVTSFIKNFQTDKEDRVLQQASISFDVSVNEIFPILSSGGALVVSDRLESCDIDSLMALVERCGVTIMGAAPSLLRKLNAHPRPSSRLRLILSGGESLSRGDVDSFLGVTRVVNGYGPTETTICASCYELLGEERSADGSIPIGKPLMNYQMYILDKNGECLPVGCAGELYIGGVGLARGYHRDPELTSRKFVENPFRRGERLYRTGDRARWRADGNVEFLGRLDQQVKIRGFRIELDEVQSLLAKHESVREALVIAREDQPGEVRLVAYLVAKSGEACDPSMIRRHLRSQLPEHMVPSHFVWLDALPLTPNGKIDRKALPPPGDAPRHRASVHEAPRTDVEKTLAAVWALVLGVPQVGVHDHFFDLGGHSLLAAQMISRVRDALQVMLPVRTVFEHPTVEGLAGQIEAILCSHTGGHSRESQADGALVVGEV